MGYHIDASTLPWARRTVQELHDAEIELGCAKEKLDEVLEALRAGAEKLHDQPYYDGMSGSFVMDYERLNGQFQAWLDRLKKDLKALDYGIRKYERGQSDDHD